MNVFKIFNEISLYNICIKEGEEMIDANLFKIVIIGACSQQINLIS